MEKHLTIDIRFKHNGEGPEALQYFNIECCRVLAKVLTNDLEKANGAYHLNEGETDRGTKFKVEIHTHGK